VANIPSAVRTDIDLFTDEVLKNPFPTYRRLRDLGPAAYLDRHGVWFLGRYNETRAALADWKTFSSAHGIGLNSTINTLWAKALICQDPPEHTAQRKLLTDRLGPRQLKVVEDTIEHRAEQLARELVQRGRFDAVRDLALDLPVNIIMDLIGWPEEVRAKLLELADGSFDPCGPENPRMQAALKQLQDIFELLNRIYDEGSLAPGGFGSTIADAAKRGEITRESAIGLLFGYVVAAFDTTISAIASGAWLFATHPEEWDLLRTRPELVTQAFNEVVRLETPIQHFSRVAKRDVDLGEGVVIPEGARVIVSYASANRDERQFEDPDRFDIRRRNGVHLGFGAGNHACAGQNLARLEGHATFKALAQCVSRFELDGTPQRRLYNVTRSFSAVPVRVAAG
jgi:cytochrome P450